MKICPKCAAQNKNSAAFCEKCGESLADVLETAPDIAGTAADLFGKAKKAAQAGAEKAQKAVAEGKAKSQERQQEKAVQRAEKATKGLVFVDPEETAVATLGSSFTQNIMAGGKVKQGSAVLTQKRLYYRGKLFSGTGRSMMTVEGEYIVSIEDITLTSFLHGESSGGKLFGLLLLLAGAVVAVPLRLIPVGAVLAAAGLVFLIKGFLGKSTILEVSFPGGRFRYDVKMYPIADMEDFQRQIHLMKDHIKNA